MSASGSVRGSRIAHWFVLAGIESLLSAVVADGMIGGRHRSNMELVAQGVALLRIGRCGHQPAFGLGEHLGGDDDDVVVTQRRGGQDRGAHPARAAGPPVVDGQRVALVLDVDAGRAIELDALVTVVREIAQRLGVATPNIDALAARGGRH